MEVKQLTEWQKRPELNRLRELVDPPKELWVKGNYSPEIFKKCVAVVGSRRMTSYGQRCLEKLIPQLVLKGYTIVSGFMYGVDQAAHQLAIENGGKTIAVLGWGISNKLQDTRDKQQEEQIIAKGGLIMSEWERQVGALWTFPRRNRLVVGLVSEVFVIEAGIKSGSLITAELAKKYKRTLWAVPGPITSKVSEGTNALIAAGEARMWLGNDNVQFSNSNFQSNSNDPIVKLITNEQLSADEVARKLNRPVEEVGATLSMMVLMGEVKEEGGSTSFNFQFSIYNFQ